MQVRATTFRRGNKTYQYAQLVESYRRKSDGVPLHRVIANLGRITDVSWSGILERSRRRPQLDNWQVFSALKIRHFEGKLLA